MSLKDAVKVVPEGSYAQIDEETCIHYHDIGPEEGHPVLFLHGSGQGASGWSNFRHNAAALAKRGYRSILADMPGFGYSSKPDRLYPLSFMAGSLVKLADHLSIEAFSLVGNSMGGAGAAWIALEHPNRVKRLVLMAPGGLESRDVYMAMEGIKTMVSVTFGPDGITRKGLRRIFELQLFNPECPNGVSDALIEERYQLSLLQIKGMVGRMRIPNLSERLSQLKTPTLAFWGHDDKFCPVSGAKILANQIPGAKVVTINACGHWVMVEHAAMFNKMTADFLDGGYDA